MNDIPIFTPEEIDAVDLPYGAVLDGTDMPTLSDYLSAKQKNGKPLRADEIYKETWGWLKQRNCENLVNPRLLESYSQAFARYITSELEDLLNILASGISSLTNQSKIASTFKSIKKSKISENTIDKFIGYFEDSFILKRVYRYDVKGRKYIGTPYKIYFEDLGLRNARLNFRQIESTYLMENIIYNELRYRGYMNGHEKGKS